MNKALMKIAIVVTTVSLVSCSTNTQNQNTAVGAVTGGVIGGLAGSAIGGGVGKAVAIGAGIVVGALIGGYVGSSMDSSDKSHMYTSVSTGHPANWVNSNTHTVYSVNPSSQYITVNGNPYCRKYTTVATIHHKSHKVHGIACRQADGTWKAVNS